MRSIKSLNQFWDAVKSSGHSRINVFNGVDFLLSANEDGGREENRRVLNQTNAGSHLIHKLDFRSKIVSHRRSTSEEQIEN